VVVYAQPRLSRNRRWPCAINKTYTQNVKKQPMHQDDPLAGLAVNNVDSGDKPRQIGHEILSP
jgi:hypothetical protein